MAKTGDIVSGAVLAGLGIYVVSEAHGWEYLGPDGPGPGFFPLWYGIAMIALSLLSIGSSALRGLAAKPVKPVNWREVGRALATWMAFTACIALLKVLGFLLSFGLFPLAGILWVEGVRGEGLLVLLCAWLLGSGFFALLARARMSAAATAACVLLVLAGAAGIGYFGVQRQAAPAAAAVR